MKIEMNDQKGFSLVETMVAMLIIILVLMVFFKAVIQSNSTFRSSRIRFAGHQCAGYYQDYLLSLPFKSPELAEGIREKVHDEFILNWQVWDISPDLKKIRLTVWRGNWRFNCELNKSNFFRR